MEATADPERAGADPAAVRAIVDALVASVADVASALDASDDAGRGLDHTRPTAIARTLRVDVSVLDRLLDLAGEMTALRGRLALAASRTGDASLARAVADLGRVSGAFADEVHAARLVELAELMADLPRVVRQAATATGKRVSLMTSGSDVVADRAVVDALAEPLVHLLRNAVDHGIEMPDVRERAGKSGDGRVAVSAVRDGNALVVHVEDDGHGVDRAAVIARARSRGQLPAAAAPDDVETLDDAALLACLALPGLTTAPTVGRVSGRGVGVDAALARVRALGGSVTLTSVLGRGTRFTLRMPLSWAIIPALLVRADGAAYALPLAHVRGTRERADADGDVPSLASLVGPENTAAARTLGGDVVLLAQPGGEPAVAVCVDALIGARDCVLKPVGVPRGAFRIAAGATILDGGEVALVLDIPAVVGRPATTAPADRRSPPCPSPLPSPLRPSGVATAPTIRAR